MLTDSARRALPNGKPISSLGFGCSSVWAKSNFPPESAANMLQLAVVEGINHFDTSPSYADGEARLGNFLRNRDPSSFVISTKLGTEHGDHKRSFDPDRMRRSFAASLKRLGLPAVDILYLHGPTRDVLKPSIFAFFEGLKAEGLISYSGVNSFDPAVVAACVDTPLDAVMLQYSISDRRFDKLIDQLAAAEKIVIAGTILAQGIFNPRAFFPRDAKSVWYLLRALKNNPLFLVEGRRLARRIEKTGIDPYEAAVRFAISNPNITSSLFGTSSPKNLVSNAQFGPRPLSDAQCRILIGTSE
jgi:D-threo-aldose 1-dehydrogenase